MKNFAVIGVGGYVAPRHLKAIKETGNRVIATMDPSDSVGVIDSYFPDSAFFTEFERFDRHLYKLRKGVTKPDYVSICSPNYLHDSHIRFGLRSDCDVICEKPLVINPWNLDGIEELEQETGKRLNAILQLRVHPSVIALRERVAKMPPATKAEIELTYITPRGKWYNISWKGQDEKSGGVVTNIGVHFFDMLGWVFGKLQGVEVHRRTSNSCAGLLEYQNAVVRWYLSTNGDDLDVLGRERVPYRSLTIDGDEFDFSGGFNDLHTMSYQNVLDGNGFGVAESRASIETVFQIRQEEPNRSDYAHSILGKLQD